MWASCQPPSPCSLMDKAPDFISGDCRFKSCHGRRGGYPLTYILQIHYTINIFTTYKDIKVQLTYNGSVDNIPMSMWPNGKGTRFWIWGLQVQVLSWSQGILLTHPLLKHHTYIHFLTLCIFCYALFICGNSRPIIIAIYPRPIKEEKQQKRRKPRKMSDSDSDLLCFYHSALCQ